MSSENLRIEGLGENRKKRKVESQNKITRNTGKQIRHSTMSITFSIVCCSNVLQCCLAVLCCRHDNMGLYLCLYMGLYPMGLLWRSAYGSSSPYSRLQCVAVCCSVLQCVAACCSVLQCVAVCCRVLQSVAVCCSVLHCSAACCIVVQCVPVCSRFFKKPAMTHDSWRS